MRAAERGLSLIELLTALAVLGILTTLAVDSYLAFSKQERGTIALKSVQAQLTKARQIAMTRNQPVRITVTPATVDGKAVNAVRWEALPCQDVWGNNCPSLACKASACGVGGCVCDSTTGGEVGPSPASAVPGLQVSTAIGVTLPPLLNGLCFLGGSGTPVLRTGTNDCDSANLLPVQNSLPFTLSDNHHAYFVIDTATGMTRLTDCSTSTLAPCP